MTFSIGDRVYWDNGQRHIRGTVTAINVRVEDYRGRVRFDNVGVAIDPDDRRQPWPCNHELLPETIVYPTWSARLRPLSAGRHVG
jgi:hypothetical protein